MGSFVVQEIQWQLVHQSGKLTRMTDQEQFPFRFDSQTCHSCTGRCCRGEGGYVWISLADLQGIAKAKDMTVALFAQQYVRQAQGKLSLQERVINGEHLCCFFDPIACCCTIYEHRPEQCRSFPFWKKYKKNYEELLLECPGVAVKQTGTLA